MKYRWKFFDPEAEIQSPELRKEVEQMKGERVNLGIQHAYHLELFRESAVTLKQVEHVVTFIILLDKGGRLVERGTTLFLDISLDLNEFYNLLAAASEREIPVGIRNMLLGTKRGAIKTGEGSNLSAYDIATTKRQRKELARQIKDPRHAEVMREMLRAHRMIMEVTPPYEG